MSPGQAQQINQAIAPQVAAAVSRQATQITQTRIAHHLDGRPAYHVQGANHLAGFLKSHGSDLSDMDIRQLDFSLPLQATHRDGGVDHLSLWRQHYSQGFAADETALSMATGAVTGAMTGIDARFNHNTLFGVGFNRSRAESDFEYAGIKGRHVTRLTGIRPYLAWQGGNQSHVWGSLALDRGEIEITINDHPGGAQRLDVALANVDLGGQGTLYRRQSDADATTLNLIADAAWSGMESTDDNGFNIHDGLIRIGADYNHRHRTARGWTLERDLEMTIRHDAGDADDHRGGGIALDGAFKAHAPHSNISYRLNANTLRGRDTRQWGIAGDLTLSPDPDHQGLSLSFKPHWGVTQTRGQQLWRHGVVAETDTVDTNTRYAIELKYGIALTHEAERLTLFARDENRAKGIGMSYQFGDDFTAGYETINTPDADTTTDHRGTVRYRRRF